MTRPRRAAIVTLLVLLGLAPRVPAAAQMMPDPRQMSGTPLPVGDVAPGTVTVRLIRGSLDKPIVNHPVELLGGTEPLKAVTSDAGRAEFKNVRIGARVSALAVVDGERLQSQEFTVPATGGIRLMLVATDAEAQQRAEQDRKLAQEPPRPGIVVLGEQTRFMFEIGDDGLLVYNILQIVNTARTPVQPTAPVAFEVPDAAERPSVLEGSSAQAVVRGRRVEVDGPFAPGATLVQFVYTMPYSGPDLTVEQRLPIALNGLSFMVQKIGGTHVTSPQMAGHREVQAQGQTFIVGEGVAVRAGDVLSFSFTGLPHTSVWPRNVALALATLILLGGAWTSLRGPRASAADPARRRKLQATRDRLFNELTTLETQRQDGRVDHVAYSERRRELIASLERVYAELDEDAAVSQAS